MGWKQQKEQTIFMRKKKKRKKQTMTGQKKAKFQQLEKKMITIVKKTMTKPHQFAMLTKKRATFVTLIEKHNLHG